MTEKPFSQACENNKHAILQVLERQLTAPGKLLEIGSGTGQHALFFSQQLPHIIWQTSDLIENHSGILAWLAEFDGDNLLPPTVLDVASTESWIDDLDAVFTANTAHIMSWPEVLNMLDGISRSLRSGGQFIIYGPFNYQNQFTSESNARFNDWLQQQAPHRAIRDFELLCEEASARGLILLEDNPMPANNRCLVFIRQ